MPKMDEITSRPLSPNLHVSPFASKTRSQSPNKRTRSPQRRSRFQALELDPLLSNLSPESTLQALSAVDAVTSDENGPSNTLRKSIENVSTFDRAFGIRAALAAQKLREWYTEVLSWKWPSRREAGLGQGFLPPPISTDSVGHEITYLGSLPANVVEEYERRAKGIREDMNALDVEALKEHVLNIHIPSRSRPISSHSTVSIELKPVSYLQLSDFSAVVTATILQALPILARLNHLLASWDVRLIVLQQIPTLLKGLNTVRLAVDTALKCLQLGKLPGSEEDLISKESFVTARQALEQKVLTLGAQMDRALDELEGRPDTLPDCWIDCMEAIETDFATWSSQAHKMAIENDWRRSAELSAPVNDVTPKRQSNSCDLLQVVPDTLGTPTPRVKRVAFDEAAKQTTRPTTPPNSSQTTPTTVSAAGELAPSDDQAPVPEHENIQPQETVTVAQSRKKEPNVHLNTVVIPPEVPGPVLEGPPASVPVALSQRYLDTDSKPFLSQSTNKSAGDAGQEAFAPQDPEHGIADLHQSSGKSAILPLELDINQHMSGTGDRGIRRSKSLSLGKAHAQPQKFSPLNQNYHFGTPPAACSEQISSSTNYQEPDADHPFSPEARNCDISISSENTRDSHNDHPDYHSVSDESLSLSSSPPDFSSSPRLSQSSTYEASSPPSPILSTAPTSNFPITPSASYSVQPSKRLGPTTPADFFIPQSHEDHLEQKISSILTTIPGRIHLSSIPPTTERGGDSGKRSKAAEPQRQNGHPLSCTNRPTTPTPTLTLTPAYKRQKRRVRMDDENPVRLYHLHRGGKQPPLKLCVRMVGEEGERVMVRVGGGWADLGEYLREYVTHHGRRRMSEGKLEVQEIPHTSPSHRSSPPLRPPSRLNTGRATPISRPGSPFESRPPSPIIVRKPRLSSASTAVRPSLTAANIERASRSTDSGSLLLPQRRLSISSTTSMFSHSTPLGLAGPIPRSRNVINPESEAWVEDVMGQARKTSATLRSKISTGSLRGYRHSSMADNISQFKGRTDSNTRRVSDFVSSQSGTNGPASKRVFLKGLNKSRA